MGKIKELLNKENLRKYFTKNKVKKYVATFVQILVVVGALGSLILLGMKALGDYTGPANTVMNNETKQTTENQEDDSQADDEESAVVENEYKGAYYLYANTRHNTVVAYGYDENNNRYPIKIMLCTIGKEIKNGSYEIDNNYAWVSSDNKWNQYNSKAGEFIWIQSAGYYDRNKYSLDTKEYNNMGQQSATGANIRLTVADAKWIYDNCIPGTVVEVGADKKLPLEKPQFTKISTIYGWDPTDPNKNNPWRSVKENHISAYSNVIKVERGAEVRYLANVIALNNKGINVTKKLKYEEFDSNVEGTYKVKYSYGSKKNKITAILTYKVVDTTAPIIEVDTHDSSLFTYKIATKKFTVETLNSESLKQKITNNIMSVLTVKDLNEYITAKNITFLFPETIYSGKNMLEIKAEDAYGNISYKAVYFYIKEKKKKAASSEETTTEEETTKESKEDTTKQTTTTANRKTSPAATTPKSTTPKSTIKSTTKPTETTKAVENTDQGEESAGEMSLDN